MLEVRRIPCDILRVQTWDGDAVIPSGAEQLLGTPWPKETGDTERGRAAVIAVGPMDWLVLGADPTAATLLSALERAFENSVFRTTPVSQALARFKIDGPETRTLLAKGCGLDLHPSHFPRGRAARTRLAGMPVIVYCSGSSSFECVVTASYADFLVLWLNDASLEFEGVTL